jgi:zinc transport system permease protein
MPAEAPTWSAFLEGLDIFRDAILTGAGAGLVLGFLGVYVVLRRMVFVSAAITQSAGLGVALAYYAQIYLPSLHSVASPTASAFLFGISSTLLLGVTPSRARLPRESLIGLVFILASGAALLVGDRISQESHGINAILFGTAVLVSKSDLHSTLGLGGLVLVLHLWLRRALVFVSFDAESARVQRLPVRLLDSVLLISIGLMVSVTTRALGAMPVFAFSVLPAIAALSLRLPLGAAFLVSATVGALSGVIGYALSFFLRLPVGATQAVVAACFAALAALGGLLMRMLGARFASSRPG